MSVYFLVLCFDTPTRRRLQSMLVEADLLYTKYDPYAMQDEWTAKNGTFPGYNCRITAMNLFGDFLSVLSLIHI